MEVKVAITVAAAAVRELAEGWMKTQYQTTMAKSTLAYVTYIPLSQSRSSV